jgi:hypothetical protein
MDARAVDAGDPAENAPAQSIICCNDYLARSIYNM